MTWLSDDILHSLKTGPKTFDELAKLPRVQALFAGRTHPDTASLMDVLAAMVRDGMVKKEGQVYFLPEAQR